ncbi:hypothetical protein Enr10x_55160 [Gimesia panareensis]|uniref:Uncharacterized protein n=1 Tax=Gimesia panareensis TaxID=2527978 RepID=A0A517QET4_9PLAN|nr:hypothetical protein Enr10x_55160 [Gimesia panareensis]
MTFSKTDFPLMKATLTISCSLYSARITFGRTRWSLGQIDLISFAARRADTWVSPATEFIVYGTFCFYWSIQALSGKPTVAPGELHLGVSTDCVDLVEGRVGVKTEFFPVVSGVCPGLAGILSRSVPVFVTMWPDRRGRILRTGANCSGVKRVKIDGDSGAVESLVPCVPVHADPPRARARWGPAYDSAGVDQVQIVQRNSEDVSV